MRWSRSRVALVILVAAMVAVAAYSAWVIHASREYTERFVLPNSQGAQYALALTDLTPRQIEILLKVEDPDFFRHGGVDFTTPGAGITTITQSLVKRLYFEKFTPGIAKLKQTLIAAYALDPLMGKDAQLRLFINTASFGHDIRGFESAAQSYFKKPLRRLNESEYLALVAMLIAPETFNVRTYPERNAERVRHIKLVVSGEYVPRGLFDVFYGKLDRDIQQHIPPLSYFESYYP